MLKVVAINGSPHKNGNTSSLIKVVFKELEAEGISTKLIHIGNEVLTGCMACFSCKKNADMKCKYKNDGFNSAFKACVEANAIILGSPVYVGGMSAQLKAFIDRACLVNKFNGEPLKRKLGAAIVAARRNGALETFNGINNFFTISQMIIVGSSYWNQGVGKEKGEVLQDEEGIKTMVTLGNNMAWLLNQLHSELPAKKPVLKKKKKKQG